MTPGRPGFPPPLRLPPGAVSLPPASRPSRRAPRISNRLLDRRIAHGELASLDRRALAQAGILALA